jgi:hypothetical protein
VFRPGCARGGGSPPWARGGSNPPRSVRLAIAQELFAELFRGLADRKDEFHAAES